MKTVSLTLGFLGAMVAAALADVSKEDLKKLAQAGVGDETILSYVRAHGPVPSLSAEDLADLKKSGVSDKVLLALISGPAANVQADTLAPSRAENYAPAAGPSTTYVYDSQSYYYPYYYPYYSNYTYPAFYPSFAFSARFSPRARFFAPVRSGGGVIRRR